MKSIFNKMPLEIFLSLSFIFLFILESCSTSSSAYSSQTEKQKIEYQNWLDGVKERETENKRIAFEKERKIFIRDSITRQKTIDEDAYYASIDPRRKNSVAQLITFLIQV